jgi:hypothetical protein
VEHHPSQTPDEAEEAAPNVASHDDAEVEHAVECRTMTAGEMCEYVEAIPDDGERVAPTNRFCGRGSRFVGFELFEHHGQAALITVWFATATDPDRQHGVRMTDGTIVPKLDFFTADGDIATTDVSPAFMEVSAAEWLGFDHVVVPEGVPGVHEEFRSICLDMWNQFLARPGRHR